jgi:flagellar basal body P-ring formation protein FlgA
VNKLANARPTLPTTPPKPACPGRRARRLPVVAVTSGAVARLGAGLLALGLAAPAPAAGASAVPDDLAPKLQQLASNAARLLWPASATPPRIEVVLGLLDPRLTLAPCEQIVPFLPPGTRPLGATRIGLHCAKGPTAWRVTLPMQVKVWAPAVVAGTTLPVGTVLQAQHLQTAEVDHAARADAAIGQPQEAIGRTLQRGLAAGDTLRSGDLKALQYFNAGDTVRVIAVGTGFSISSEGQALGPGTAGRQAQVRLEGGRIVTGVATGDRRVEVAL